MSQRLQSIFFFVAAILFALLFFLPIADYLGGTSNLGEVNNNLRFFAYGVEPHPEYGGELPANISKWFALPVLILSITALLLSGYLAIGLHRAIKMKDFVNLHRIARIDIVICVALVALVFAVYVPAVGKFVNEVVIEYKIGAFLPLAALILVLLGATGLRKDIKRVRSTDRIR